MIPLSLEALQTREARRPRCRKIARRHDTEARSRGLTFVGPDGPCVCLAVEDRLFDPGVELNVAPEVEAVSHMVDVTQDLRLRAVAFGHNAIPAAARPRRNTSIPCFRRRSGTPGSGSST